MTEETKDGNLGVEMFDDLNEFISQAPEVPEEDSADLTIPVCDKQHLVFDFKNLRETLLSIKEIMSLKADTVEKSIRFQSDGETVEISTPLVNDVRGAIILKPENTENIFNGSFIIEFEQIAYISSTTAGYILIVPGDDDVYVEFHDTSVNLCYLDVDSTLYNSIYFSQQHEDLEILRGQNITSLMKLIDSSALLALRPEDQRVRFEGGKALANYLTAAISFKSQGLKSSMRTFDCKVFYTFFKNSVEIKYKKVDEGFYYEADGKKLLLPDVFTDDLNSVGMLFDNYESVNKIQVNFGRLKKSLLLISKIVGMEACPDFQIKDGEFRAKSQSRTGRKVDIVIGTGYNIDFEFKYPVSSFLRILSLTNTEGAVQIEISPDKVLQLKTDKYDLIFFNVVK